MGHGRTEEVYEHAVNHQYTSRYTFMPYPHAISESQGAGAVGNLATPGRYDCGLRENFNL
jgi:hypothetical protein